MPHTLGVGSKLEFSSIFSYQELWFLHSIPLPSQPPSPPSGLEAQSPSQADRAGWGQMGNFSFQL